MPLFLGSKKILLINNTNNKVITFLRRNGDGTVSVMSLSNTWIPKVTRQGDGTVLVA